MAAKTMQITEAGAARSRYRTRMLVADEVVTMDGPTARLNERMGWAVPYKAKKAKRPQLDHDQNGEEGGSKSAEGDLTALRAEYLEKIGKRAFNGWDADTLREKIAAAE